MVVARKSVVSSDLTGTTMMKRPLLLIKTWTYLVFAMTSLTLNVFCVHVGIFADAILVPQWVDRRTAVMRLAQCAYIALAVLALAEIPAITRFAV